MRVAIAAAILLTLAACGPKADTAQEAKAPPAKTGRALPTGPQLSGVGTVASVSGVEVVLDHEAVEGGLSAGRTAFQADSAVLAEGPVDPGSRVAFRYQDWTPKPLLTELKAR